MDDLGLCYLCGEPIPASEVGTTYLTDYDGQVLYEGEPICENCANSLTVNQDC